MPARASYELKISGELAGSVDSLRSFGPSIRDVLPSTPPKSARGAGWPAGFVLDGYKTCLWDSRIEAYSPTITTISFFAELNIIVEGSIYDSRARLIEDVTWFYHYRDQPWYQELAARLRQLNEDFIAKHGQPALRSRIQFQSWKWYCGNGGGG